MSSRRRRASSSRRQSADLTDKVEKPIALKDERYVVWRNETPRMVEPTIHGHFVRLWMVGTTKSLPESWTKEAEKLGLTRVGFAQ